MPLSRDQHRQLTEINQILSHDRRLSAVADLFAEPPGFPHARSPRYPTAWTEMTRCRRFVRMGVSVLVAVLGLALGFALAPPGESPRPGFTADQAGDVAAMRTCGSSDVFKASTAGCAADDHADPRSFWTGSRVSPGSQAHR